MMSSNEVNYYSRVNQIIKKIPKGRVMTYGQIARLAKIKDARVVGWALHANRDSKIPCHRVVDREGKLASGYAFGGWQEQRRKLLEEGIEFVDDDHVDSRFYSIHRYCQIKEVVEVVNSNNVDPATADPKPLLRRQHYCLNHRLYGPVEITEGP